MSCLALVLLFPFHSLGLGLGASAGLDDFLVLVNSWSWACFTKVDCFNSKARGCPIPPAAPRTATVCDMVGKLFVVTCTRGYNVNMVWCMMLCCVVFSCSLSLYRRSLSFSVDLSIFSAIFCPCVAYISCRSVGLGLRRRIFS
jgi:hypothetical protein